MSVAPAEPHPAFTARALLRRMLTHAWAKGLGTSAGMSAFFVGYFALLRAPAFPVTTMPLTWLDHLLPFQAWTLLPYCSLWLYISLAASFIVDLRQLRSFALGCLGLSLAGFALFYFFPTTIPISAIDWNRHSSLLFLKSIDQTGNACPSLHVAFAIFTALWFERLLPALGGGVITRVVNFAWAVLITYATLGTRQHVALDVYWGAALGALAASLNFLATPCRERACATPRPLFAAVAVIKLCSLLLWSCGVPFLWCLILFLSGGALMLWQLFAPNAQGLLRVVTRFQTVQPEVWLTIDDGPDQADTPRILDLLEKHHARATFFLIGERAHRHPDLVREIARRGHEIGHHTRSHPSDGLWRHSPAQLARELDVNFGAGLQPTRFRAPMGIKNLFLARALAARGLTCIGWSIRSRDSFARDPALVAQRVLRRLRPGTILLFHEGPFLRPEIRVEALRIVVEQASARDFRFIIPPPDGLR